MATQSEHPSAEFVSFQAAVAGRYSLERELGRGGMGVVFLAREVALDRMVALKLLPSEMASRPGVKDRFLREARTAARLSHPNIVPIHAVDEIDGFVFFAMAYVEGGTVESLTLDLESAKEVSEAMTNLLEGHQEVERLLQERRRTGVITLGPTAEQGA